MNAVVRWVGCVALVVAIGGPVVATCGEAGTAGCSGEPVIEIWKTQRRMEIRHGDAVVRDFKISLGQDPRDGKRYRGDMRTPVGRYYVSEKHVSRFHRFLGISYPNVEDADRGYSQGIIDAGQWADIFFAQWRGAAPTWRTQLGGRVGIHGTGGRPHIPVDWTEGCIAISNEDIEFLYDYAPVGTPVIINE